MSDINSIEPSNDCDQVSPCTECEVCGVISIVNFGDEELTDNKCRQCFERHISSRLHYIPYKVDGIIKWVSERRLTIILILSWILGINIGISISTHYSSTCEQQIKWMAVSFYCHILATLFLISFIFIKRFSRLVFMLPPFACVVYFLHFWSFSVPYTNSTCTTLTYSRTATQVMLVSFDVIIVMWLLCFWRSYWVRKQVGEVNEGMSCKTLSVEKDIGLLEMDDHSNYLE